MEPSPDATVFIVDDDAGARDALAWLLRGTYLQRRDGALNGLATPARIAALVIVSGLAMAGLLWLAYEVVK